MRAVSALRKADRVETGRIGDEGGVSEMGWGERAGLRVSDARGVEKRCSVHSDARGVSEVPRHWPPSLLLGGERQVVYE